LGIGNPVSICNAITIKKINPGLQKYKPIAKIYQNPNAKKGGVTRYVISLLSFAFPGVELHAPKKGRLDFWLVACSGTSELNMNLPVVGFSTKSRRLGA